MGQTFWEQKAECLLAERGGKDSPRRFVLDLADWLEEANKEGREAAFFNFRHEIRNAAEVLHKMLKVSER